MAFYGSLIFYKKNGVSEPFTLSYGKTTIGSLDSHHIRIKSERQISCILDSNEDGVTILVNENDDQDILINSEVTSKYTVLKNEDCLEVGNKKFKYSNPSLKEEYLEKAQHTLNKKIGTLDQIKSEMDLNTTPLKRLQKTTLLDKRRRFSTGCKIVTAKNSPRNIEKNLFSSKHNSISQSPSKVRFSRRMVAKRNSTLASVMENEIFDFQSPKTTPVKTNIYHTSFLATLESPSVKKNKTFSGSSKFSSPLPARNKTYSGNISDVSENITTPENNVTVASITPLNVSKKSKKSLNRSRTLSYVDFPNSSTPKSAIKMNRSSSLYRPLVEDITPASPLPRSSLRNSSLKKFAFTQRRSVNFNISSSSDHTSLHESDNIGVLEASLTGNKRKRSIITEDMLVSPGSKKKKKSIHDQDPNSLHDSHISGMQNLSNTCLSDKDELENVSTSSNPKGIISSKDEADSENQSLVSWNVEVSSTDMNMSGLSELSSVAETPQKSRKSTRLSMLSANSVDDINQFVETNASQRSDLKEHQYSTNFSENITTSNMESILDDSLNDSSDDLKSSISSKSRRSNTKIIHKGMEKVRSQSLNLKRESKESVSKRLKSLGSDLKFYNSGKGSLRNISSTPTVLAGYNSRSKSFNLESKVTHSQFTPSKASTSMNFDFSPIISNPLNDVSDDSKSVSSRSRRSNVRIRDKGKIRSKSLNLGKETKETVKKHSKTLGSNLTLSIAEQKSLRNISTISKAGIGSTRRSSISKSRSRSKLSNTRVLSKTSTSMTHDFSPVKLNLDISENTSNQTDSFVSSVDVDGASTSNSSSVFVNSRSEMNNLTNELSKSRSIYNIGDSFNSGSSNHKNVRKSPLIVTTRNSLNSKKIESPASSRISLRIPSECSSLLSDVKRAPKRLVETPNLSFNGTNDPTNIKPMEKLLQDNLEGSIRRSSRSLKLAEESFTDLEDKESIETSLSRSSKSLGSESVKSLNKISPSNLSFEVSTRKTTPRNIKKMTNQRTISNDLTEVAGVEELLKAPIVLMPSKKELGNVIQLRTSKVKNSPKNDLSNVVGLKKLMATPKIQNSPKNDLTNVAGVEKLLKTPNNDLSNGVKKLLRTPKIQKSPENDHFDVGGVKNLMKTPKVQDSTRNDLTKIRGVKKLTNTPKLQKSPRNDLTNVEGVKKLMKTPKVQTSPKNDLSNIGGVKKLMKTPKVQKSPNNDLTNIGGVKKMMKTPKVQKSPTNDLTNIGGVKKLMKTPKVQKSPNNDLTNIRGVKKLMKTPKVQKSPTNDLTNIAGIKKLMKTPKVQKSPKNDLSNVGGVKKLMVTPKIQKSPKNDLTNVGGVKKLMTTPNLQKSPNNDLTKVSGLKKLMASPKLQKSPKNDLTNVKGIKKILKTPKVQKSPKNDLLDVIGIRNLLRTPKNKAADESHDLSGIDILFNHSQESNFDQILDKKPLRTYGRSPKLNTTQKQLDEPETPEHVLKWIEEQSKQERAIQVETRKQKRRLAQSSDEVQENTVTPNKRQKVTTSTCTNKDESMLNISSAIISQPSSTPKTDGKTTPHSSQADISNTTQTNKENERLGTRSMRSKRKLEDIAQEEEPSLKKTRGKQSNKEEEKGDNLKESQIKSPDKKETRKTRRAQQKDDFVEKLPEQTKTRPRRAIKAKENTSLETSKKTGNRQTIKQTKEKKGSEESTLAEEEIKGIKNTRSKRGRLQVELENIVEDSAPNKRGNFNKNEEAEDDTSVGNKPKSKWGTGNNKNIKEEEIIGMEDKPESNKRGRRNRKVKNEEITTDIESELEPKKRGRRNKKIDEKKSTDIEDKLKIKKGGTEEESIEIESTSQTTKGKNRKNTRAEGSKGKSEAPIKKSTRRTKMEDTNSANKDDPEPQIKNTRRTKIETPVSEETEKMKFTRSNKGKNKKYNDEEWDTPVKKKQEKNKAVTFKDDVEHLNVPIESKSDGVRTLRKRRNIK